MDCYNKDRIRRAGWGKYSLVVKWCEDILFRLSSNAKTVKELWYELRSVQCQLRFLNHLLEVLS